MKLCDFLKEMCGGGLIYLYQQDLKNGRAIYKGQFNDAETALTYLPTKFLNASVVSYNTLVYSRATDILILEAD